MDQQKIEPIENFIINGLINRLANTFGKCTVFYSNASNRLQTLRDRNKNLRFPYLLLNLNSISFNTEFYNSHYLARKGMKVRLADSGNALAKVRLLPAVFDFKVEYFTDKNAGDDSALYFIKRWLFARRCGYLKYSVKFGYEYAINVLMDDSVSQPMKEQETDQMSVYQCEANLQVQGFVSESQLLTEGVLNNLSLETRIDGHANSEVTFWSA